MTQQSGITENAAENNIKQEIESRFIDFALDLLGLFSLPSQRMDAETFTKHFPDARGKDPMKDVKFGALRDAELHYFVAAFRGRDVVKATNDLVALYLKYEVARDVYDAKSKISEIRECVKQVNKQLFNGRMQGLGYN